MVWSSGNADKPRRRSADHAIKEMQCHYTGGVTTLSKSTASYGREMIANRLQQKNIAANTKNHKLLVPLKTSPSPNKQQQQPRSTTTSSRRHTWFGGRSSSNKDLNNNNYSNNTKPTSTTAFRAQTPNHTVSAGRSFSDRLIRAVSPSKASSGYEGNGDLHPLTTAALTTVKPVAANGNARGRRGRHPVLPDSRDDHRRDYRCHDQENSGGSSIVSNPAAAAPIHELNDRLARIERRLWHDAVEQHSAPPQGRRRQKQRYGSPSSLRYRCWDPSSTSSNSTPTPTLFAHTKKMVEQERERHPVKTWPSSEDDDDDDDDEIRIPAPPPKSKEDRGRQRRQSTPSSPGKDKDAEKKKNKKTKNENKSAPSHSTPKHVLQQQQRNDPSKVHHAAATTQRQPLDKQDEEGKVQLDGSILGANDDDQSTSSSLPPTPKMSNFQTARSSSDSQTGNAKKVEAAGIASRNDDNVQSGTQDGHEQEPSLEEQPEAATTQQQPQQQEESQPRNASIIARFSLPTVPCATPREDAIVLEELEEVNSILATHPAAPKSREATPCLMDNAHVITGVLSDLSSSTNGGNTNGNHTGHFQNTQSGRGLLTIQNINNRARSLLFSNENCAIPIDPMATGPVTRMRKMCAGEESGSQSSTAVGGGNNRVTDDSLTTRPSIARTVPREIPLVPERSTPDISLMDHDSASEEEPSPIAGANGRTNQNARLQVSASSLKVRGESAGQKTQQQKDRDPVSPRPHHRPTSPQRAIPIVPNASKEEDNADAQQYWKSMYQEAGNTHDVLQDLLQTSMEPEAAMKPGPPGIEVFIDYTKQKEVTSPRRRNSPQRQRSDGNSRILFSALQKDEDVATKKQRPLLPKRNGTKKAISRPGAKFPARESPEKARETTEKHKNSSSRTKRNGMTLASSVVSIADQLKSDEKETQKRSEENMQALGKRNDAISDTAVMERKSVSIPPSTIIREHKEAQQNKRNDTISDTAVMERKTVPIPPSAIVRGYKEAQQNALNQRSQFRSSSCNFPKPAPTNSPADVRDQRQHKADAALVDIRHLHNQSLPIGRVQKYKLSPYNPKADNLSKNHWGWFGRRKIVDKQHFLGVSAKESKGVRTLEAIASSAASTITTQTTEGHRRSRKEIIDLSNEGSGSYHSIEQSREESATSSDMSHTTASNANTETWADESEESQNENNAKSSILRGTTYDAIIQDLKTFESQLPIAEFAVVEVGDDSDTEQAHRYFMNKRSDENELLSGKDEEEPFLVEMPFGLETIAELGLEDGFSMEMSSDIEENVRARDDSRMDTVKLSVSFAEQLQQLQRSHRLSKAEPTSPGKSYYI